MIHHSCLFLIVHKFAIPYPIPQNSFVASLFQLCSSYSNYHQICCYRTSTILLPMIPSTQLRHDLHTASCDISISKRVEAESRREELPTASPGFLSIVPLKLYVYYSPPYLV